MSIDLFLVDADNEFQQLLRDEALAAARRTRLDLNVQFTGGDFSAQLTQLRKSVSMHPEAILVMAVRDRGLSRIVSEAMQEGIHWVFLNRAEDDLDELRRKFPRVALTTVCPDEVETGRIQGRLFQKLHRPGTKVLYVEGSRRSLAARDRTAGVMEALSGSAVDLVRLEAGWTAAESRDAVQGWLRVAIRGGMRLGLVGGQNDLIATGAIEALEAAAAEQGRPELASTPIIGCDGTPGLGQRLVREGKLKATVVLPCWTGPAIETIAGVLSTGKLPRPVVSVVGAAFPPEEQLRGV